MANRRPTASPACESMANPRYRRTTGATAIRRATSIVPKSFPPSRPRMYTTPMIPSEGNSQRLRSAPAITKKMAYRGGSVCARVSKSRRLSVERFTIVAPTASVASSGESSRSCAAPTASRIAPTNRINISPCSLTSEDQAARRTPIMKPRATDPMSCQTRGYSDR